MFTIVPFFLIFYVHDLRNHNLLELLNIVLLALGILMTTTMTRLQKRGVLVKTLPTWKFIGLVLSFFLVVEVNVVTFVSLYDSGVFWSVLLQVVTLIDFTFWMSMYFCMGESDNEPPVINRREEHFNDEEIVTYLVNPDP